MDDEVRQDWTQNEGTTLDAWMLNAGCRWGTPIVRPVFFLVTLFQFFHFFVFFFLSVLPLLFLLFKCNISFFSSNFFFMFHTSRVLGWGECRWHLPHRTFRCTSTRDNARTHLSLSFSPSIKDPKLFNKITLPNSSVWRKCGWGQELLTNSTGRRWRCTPTGWSGTTVRTTGVSPPPRLSRAASRGAPKTTLQPSPSTAVLFVTSPAPSPSPHLQRHATPRPSVLPVRGNRPFRPPMPPTVVQPAASTRPPHILRLSLAVEEPMATIYPRPPPSASSPMAASCREDSVQPPYGRSPRRLFKISVECGHDVAGGVRVKWIEPDPIDDNSLSSFDCPYPESPPKGDSFSDALVLALSFWLEIGANKFVLSVISEGYFLPFVSLPDCLLFNNLPSAVKPVLGRVKSLVSNLSSFEHACTSDKQDVFIQTLPYICTRFLYCFAHAPEILD